MATTDAHPSITFSHVGHDDDMELSSDHGRYDGDFDIDVDQGGDYVGDADIDQMQEDLRSDRGMTDLLDPTDVHTNDDEMAEGSIDGRYEPQDGMMQDEGMTTDLHDEDLEDYVGDEPEYAQKESNEVQEFETVREQGDTTYDDETGDTTLRPDEHVFDDGAQEFKQDHTDGTDDTAQLDETQNETVPAVNVGLPADIEEPHLSINEVQQQKANDQTLVSTVVDFTESQDAGDAGPQPMTGDASVRNPPEHKIDHEYQNDDTVVVEHGEKAVDEVEYNDELGEDKSRIIVEESAPSAQEEHTGSFTVTGLHQTIVKYEGSEVFLFPSGDPTSQEEYFLEDDNIVNGSIGDMLEACRVVLGGDISEDEELELTVEDLGLSLSEDSTPAFSASFSEILQLYVQLHALDGVAHPPPMYMTLSTKTRFTNRLTLLAHAVSEGRGLSSVPPTKEMLYDEEETFTEYHDYEEGDQIGGQEEDQEDDENEAQPGQAIEHSEQIEKPQLSDQGTPDEGDNEHDQANTAFNHENHQTGEGEHASLEEHSLEGNADWEDSNFEEASADVDEPAINEDSQTSNPQPNADPENTTENESEYLIDYSDDDYDLTPTSALNVTASAEDDETTNAENEGNESALEKLVAAEDAENIDDILDGEKTGEVSSTNKAEAASHGPDEIDFDDDTEVVGNQGVKSLDSGDSQGKMHAAQENTDTSAQQEQEHVKQPTTTDTADEDLPPVPEDDLDDIDFDDDEIDNVAESKFTSLKRSFTEHTGDQDLPNDKQDAKRVCP